MENKNFDERLDLFELYKILWSGRFIIISLTFSTGLLALIYSLLIPNIYTSTAVLAPQNSNESFSSKLSQFSSIAAIGGINLPSENATMSQEAMKRIKSFSFFSQYFLPEIELENIMAAESWDAKSNVIIYDKRKYDVKKNIWVRKVKFPKKVIPSNQEAYEEYQDILKIFEDKDTSFVNLSIDHVSPLIARQWVEIIVENINLSMQNQDRNNAESSIDFLNDYSKSTNLQSVQDAISNLLEIEMQTLMVTSSNDFYVYEVIDYPIVPEVESYPNRILILIMGTMFGFLIGLTIILFRYYGKKSLIS